MDRQLYEAQLFTRILAAFSANGAERNLHSIILSGSFGRGEATYHGGVLESDVELGLVYRRGRRRQTQEMLRTVAAQFSEELNCMPFPRSRIRRACNFNYSLLPSRWKTVFTFDLFRGSKTLWGEELLEANASRDLRLDPYEAKRIVANRIGELALSEGAGERRRWQAKLILAIGAAWLIAEGLYQSSYRAQNRSILEHTDALSALLGSSFPEVYHSAFAFLREGADCFAAEDPFLRSYVEIIGDFFKRKGISRPRVNNFARWLKYCLKYLRHGGRRLGRIEDNILSSLLAEYAADGPQLQKSAVCWHAVLY